MELSRTPRSSTSWDSRLYSISASTIFCAWDGQHWNVQSPNWIFDTSELWPNTHPMQIDSGNSMTSWFPCQIWQGYNGAPPARYSDRAQVGQRHRSRPCH